MKGKIVATIIKIGNSKGLRLSAKDLARFDVDIGDEVEFSGLKRVRHKPDTAKAIAALKAISEMNGTLANIDIEEWQKQRDAEWDEREKRLNDLRRL